tara:strand:- start:7900 stop:8508 length:609 start_codon:yes stop_codon:yes gene_type:complete
MSKVDVSKLSEKEKARIYQEIGSERRDKMLEEEALVEAKEEKEKNKVLKKAQAYIKAHPYQKKQIVNIAFTVNQNWSLRNEYGVKIDFDSEPSDLTEATYLVNCLFEDKMVFPKLNNEYHDTLEESIESFKENIKALEAFVPFHCRVEIAADYNGGKYKYDVVVSSTNNLSQNKLKKIKAQIRQELKSICSPKVYIFKDVKT